MSAIAGLLALADGHPFLFVVFILLLYVAFENILGTLKVMARGWPPGCKCQDKSSDT